MRVMGLLSGVVLLLSLSSCSLLTSAPQEYAQTNAAFWLSTHTPVQHRWSRYIGTTTPYSLCLRPVIASNQQLIFSARPTGQVSAWHVDTGRSAWKLHLPDQSIAALLVSGEDLLIASQHHVYLVDGYHGRLKKVLTFSLKGFQGVPLVTHNLVIMRSHSGQVEAREKTSGKLVWHFMPTETAGMDFSHFTSVSSASCHSMLIDHGSLLTIDALGHLWSLDAQTGEIHWHLQNPKSDESALLPNTVESPVGELLSNERFVCSSFLNGLFRCFQHSDTQAVSIYEQSSIGPLHLNSRDEANLYLLQYGSRVSSLMFSDLSHPHLLWQKQLDPMDVYTAPVVWGRYVVLGSEKGRLVFLVRQSGMIDYIDHLDVGVIHAAPIVTHQYLFLVTDQGWLLGYQLISSQHQQ